MNQSRNQVFSGKYDRIKERYEAFRSIDEAPRDVDAFLNRDLDHEYAEDSKRLPKWIKASTAFTDYTGPRLAESKNVLLLGNRSSFVVGQYGDDPARAGMSVVHILGIPKAALFNAVSLDGSTVSIVDDIIYLFRQSWADPDFRNRVSKHQEDAIKGQIKMQIGKNPDPKASEAAIQHYQELKPRIETLKFHDFAFGFHLWPDNSVGHLHMHIIATPQDCRRYSTFLNDEKTVDALDVRDYIRSHVHI